MEKECKRCKRLFRTFKAHFNRRVYCSIECRVGESGVKQSKNCNFCGKEYLIHQYRKNKSKYCSTSCLAKAKFTKLDGHKTPINQIERSKFRNSIQKIVFKRDNYTCQMCLQRGGRLQVDHIQAWAEYVELRFSTKNCRTLCMKCHYQLTYGRPMPDEIKTWGHNLKKVSLYV